MSCLASSSCLINVCWVNVLNWAHLQHNALSLHVFTWIFVQVTQNLPDSCYIFFGGGGRLRTWFLKSLLSGEVISHYDLIYIHHLSARGSHCILFFKRLTHLSSCKTGNFFFILWLIKPLLEITFLQNVSHLIVDICTLKAEVLIDHLIHGTNAQLPFFSYTHESCHQSTWNFPGSLDFLLKDSRELYQ